MERCLFRRRGSEPDPPGEEGEEGGPRCLFVLENQ